MSDEVQNEWRRLLGRLRRQGTMETAKYVSGLVRKGGYPLWYTHQLAEYLIKRGELAAAEVLLKAIRRFGTKHFLIDLLYSRWLWCLGERTKAIRFTERKAKFWSQSCLYNQLSAMYKLKGDDQKAEKYLGIAGSLAELELARKPKGKPTTR